MGYYENYLTSNHWKEIKRECKEIGLFNKCIICGEEKKIQIHHLNYDCKFKEDILQDLVPLCSNCHKYVHEVMKNCWYEHLTKKRFLEIFRDRKKNTEAKWIPKKIWKLIRGGRMTMEEYNNLTF